ncbi:hypothetical protein [Hymenobacter norwichensis]|uniref:hypothetical protein n=1 Tax=Hymenobacter norwichensis TaxID=223903 RepID=UPI0012F9F2EE|nr:hypothetical protein [Hymenobacter norwichensis]
MKKSTTTLITATVVFFSCTQSSESTSNAVGGKTPNPTKHATSRPTRRFSSRHEYVETNGARVLIQNSFPKSRINYTEPTGRKYIYAVFWTQIINKTPTSLELAIDFPADSFELPASSGNYMKLLLPPDTLIPDKELLSDYGLAAKPFLDQNLRKPTSIRRTIRSTDSSAFYVVTLSNRGVGGTLRTGFSLEHPNLVYRVNEKAIPGGKIDLKKLMFPK